MVANSDADGLLYNADRNLIRPTSYVRSGLKLLLNTTGRKHNVRDVPEGRFGEYWNVI